MKTGIAIYLLIGFIMCGQYTYDSWVECDREADPLAQVFITTMWAPAVAWVIISMPFDKQPEKSCFSD